MILVTINVSCTSTSMSYIQNSELHSCLFPVSFIVRAGSRARARFIVVVYTARGKQRFKCVWVESAPLATSSFETLA